MTYRFFLGLAVFFLMFPLNWSRLYLFGDLPPDSARSTGLALTVGLSLTAAGVGVGWLGWTLRKIHIAPESALFAKFADGAAPQGFFERQEFAKYQAVRQRLAMQGDWNARSPTAKNSKLSGWPDAKQKFEYEVSAKPLVAVDGEEEPNIVSDLDPAQRKFCHGCATPLHVSAQICPHCGAPQQVTALIGARTTKQPFPHGWHIIITVLTMGLWLIPYILIWGFRDKNRYA